MKAYKDLFKCMVFALAAVAFAGCSIASVSSKPGTYSMNGYTTSPEAMAATLSDNYVQELNTQKYWDAVERGQAYPYPGGAVGTDMQYYYGNILPPAGSGPMTVQPAGTPDGSVDERLRKVEEKANDSLRMHKKLQKKLNLDETQQ